MLSAEICQRIGWQRQEQKRPMITLHSDVDHGRYLLRFIRLKTLNFTRDICPKLIVDGEHCVEEFFSFRRGRYIEILSRSAFRVPFDVLPHCVEVSRTTTCGEEGGTFCYGLEGSFFGNDDGSHRWGSGPWRETD